MSIHMLLKLLVLILSGARLHGLLKHRLGRTAKYEAAAEHQIDYEEQLDVAPYEARSERSSMDKLYNRQQRGIG